MSLWNRIFGYFKKVGKALSSPPQIDQADIEKLEKQLHLPPDYDVIDGEYSGDKAEQYLREQGISPPITPLPLRVIDTSRMRFSDYDKNLEKRIDAAKQLARAKSL